MILNFRSRAPLVGKQKGLRELCLTAETHGSDTLCRDKCGKGAQKGPRFIRGPRRLPNCRVTPPSGEESASFGGRGGDRNSRRRIAKAPLDKSLPRAAHASEKPRGDRPNESRLYSDRDDRPPSATHGRAMRRAVVDGASAVS